MFIMRLNGRVFVCELSVCEFNSCYSYFNFGYCTSFEQGVSWHSGNYEMYIHSKTCMWHDKNTQLKTCLLVYTVI